MTYIPHPQHRSAKFAAKKSQWSILESEELACYTTATANNWTCGSSYWGLYLLSATPVVLGVAPKPDQEPLHIAKFVGDAGNWHGYPVAHWLSPFDKPDALVLNAWVAAGYISVPKMAKIHRGKRCAL